ncbi:MAG TPA: dihydrofolate reductase family protein [Bacteroidota bacterium]|nr:dihydrofolate reductase family protein [Bacteroidota bacterium]
MRPRIICHMLSSIDGRIDGKILDRVIARGEYETTGAELKGDAWICGRTTMQLHFADKRPFVSRSRKPSGPQPVFVATRAKSYAVAVDTTGKLRWSSNDIDGDHLVCIVSERAPLDYLTMLRGRKISYIVTGRSSVDLAKAVQLLHEHFGIKRLLLEGGGNINGAFLDAGLIDELSLLLVPGIDGRREIPTVFDGMNPKRRHGTALRLLSAAKRKGGTLWLRYQTIS